MVRFARCHPLPPAYGHGAARRLLRKSGSQVPRNEYAECREKFDTDDDETPGWSTRLLPDPARARLRVYVTQSTHKTLTSLRQGSMIHVHDQDFQHKVSETFHEAYMTHTSTSPNYQILASLDVGRRQVELEGFELVKKQVEMAMVLREKVLIPTAQPLFPVSDGQGHDSRRVPQEGIESAATTGQGWTDFFEAWRIDEFVLDPAGSPWRSA